MMAFDPISYHVVGYALIIHDGFQLSLERFEFVYRCYVGEPTIQFLDVTTRGGARGLFQPYGTPALISGSSASRTTLVKSPVMRWISGDSKRLASASAILL